MCLVWVVWILQERNSMALGSLELWNSGGISWLQDVGLRYTQLQSDEICLARHKFDVIPPTPVFRVLYHGDSILTQIKGVTRTFVAQILRRLVAQRQLTFVSLWGTNFE